jgi:hypothetical protein
MVLLAAVAVLEGYLWLDVIPAGRTDLSATAFALLAVPAALFLVRSPRRPDRRWPVRLVTVSAGAVFVATVLEIVFHQRWSARALGASDLLMAATVFGSAVIGGGLLDP